MQGTLNTVFMAMLNPAWLVRAAMIFACCACSGIVLTHALRFWIRREKWLHLPLSKSAWRFLIASLILGIVQSFMAAIAYRFLLIPRTFQDLSWLPQALAIWTITFVLWIALYTSVVQFYRAQEAERRRFDTELTAKEAKLSALLRQVNPHFFFNSLNSIRALIYEDPNRAGSMIDELAGLLRYSLQSGDKAVVTFADELETVVKYLNIEKIRFEDRLQVDYRIDPSTMNCLLPPMLLQTLVENAVKHGLEHQGREGTIRVSARLNQNCLCLSVSNPGRLNANLTSTRIGLQNARQRLALLSGGEARLSLEEADGCVQADLFIPQGAELANSHSR